MLFSKKILPSISMAVETAQPSSSLDTYLHLRSRARQAFNITDKSISMKTEKVDIPKRIRIAQYSHVYGADPLWNDDSGAWESCGQPCEAIGGYGDASSAATADVVVLDIQTFRSVPWARPAKQIWVGTYFESPDHYPNRKNPQIMSQFNVTMGFRPDDDLPVFNMVYDTMKGFAGITNLTLPTWEAKQARPELMSVWISNCNTDRTHRKDILKQLASSKISYASYGRCWNTHSSAQGVTALTDADWRRYGSQNLGAELVAVAAQYLFFFAAENSDYPYYITEKVFHGLAAGSVPVYVGDAENLKKIAPPHSIIYANDFESVGALASHLHTVAQNPELYEQYLKWRQDSDALNKLEAMMALPAWASTHGREYACALCEYMHAIGS